MGSILRYFGYKPDTGRCAMVYPKYHEQINIQENATGYSYEKIFAKFISDESLDFAEVDDPYIKSRHQIL
ncbi:MIT domain-containing 1-like [Brachionus plicatilis]|uniref:MIT domain-containing 1-like n=1 Tax=Brachionus plicatilis TaxID=10195 RepID=A0A3M7R968_BRAPC|nr:MIT domain-containing 1-like [Brachionus plicatilis]